MALYPRSAHESIKTYKNEKQMTGWQCMHLHRHIMKSSPCHLKCPKNVIFQGIGLNIGTHTYQDVPSDMFYVFFFTDFLNRGIKSKYIVKIQIFVIL